MIKKQSFKKPKPSSRASKPFSRGPKSSLRGSKPFDRDEKQPMRRESLNIKDENQSVKKDKQAQGELIYGINPVVELLKARRRKVVSIYTTKPTPKGWLQIENQMPKYKIAIQYVAREVLTRMVGNTDHQSVVAWVQPYGFRKKPFEANKSPFVVLLDGVQDARNLGAIVRSAYCTGADGVIICKKNGAPLNAASIKASAGLAERIEIYQAASVQSAAQELKDAGYNLYLAMFDGVNASDCTFKSPACLVIGSEGIGITGSIQKAGEHVTIEQKADDVSYNASVAAGILLHIMGTQLKRI